MSPLTGLSTPGRDSLGSSATYLKIVAGIGEIFAYSSNAVISGDLWQDLKGLEQFMPY